MDMTASGLRESRLRAGLTQRQLAQRAGTSQPAVAAFEAGTRRPSPETATRLRAALRVRPSVLLNTTRDKVREVLTERGVANPRIFGSVSRGEDTAESDLDLLVTVPPDFDIFDKVLLVESLEKAFGAPVDVVPDDARGPIVARAREEAVPL